MSNLAKQLLKKKIGRMWEKKREEEDKRFIFSYRLPLRTESFKGRYKHMEMRKKKCCSLSDTVNIKLQFGRK